jgi:hypothetical protein
MILGEAAKTTHWLAMLAFAMSGAVFAQYYSNPPVKVAVPRAPGQAPISRRASSR